MYHIHTTDADIHTDDSLEAFNTFERLVMDIDSGDVVLSLLDDVWVHMENGMAPGQALKIIDVSIELLATPSTL